MSNVRNDSENRHNTEKNRTEGGPHYSSSSAGQNNQHHGAAGGPKTSTAGPNKTPKRNKKKPTWMKILFIVLAVIFAIALAGLIFVLYQLDRIKKIEPVEKLAPESEYFETSESDGSGYESVDPNDITWNNNETVDGEDDVINILLIGQDRRPGEVRARSDSMIIATINKSDKTVKLTSLMRDLYVQLPGYSDNRINAAYSFGGMELLDDTIKQNFDIDIDGNIEVDFSGFTSVIDAVGGVDMELSEAEIAVINKSASSDDGTKLPAVAGTYHLNGSQALTYSRIRYVGNADFGRTERQRKVLLAAFDNVKKLNLTEMLALADAVLPLMATDMNRGNLVRLASDVFMMGIDTIETHNIPEDASYSAANIKGMDVLVPDINECRKVLQQIIYGEE